MALLCIVFQVALKLQKNFWIWVYIFRLQEYGQLLFHYQLLKQLVPFFFRLTDLFFLLNYYFTPKIAAIKA